MKIDTYTIFVFFFILLSSTLVFFLFRYGSKVSKHPCQVCAGSLGEDIVCTTRGLTRIFLENGSVVDLKEFSSPQEQDIFFKHYPNQNKKTQNKSSNKKAK